MPSHSRRRAGLPNALVLLIALLASCLSPLLHARTLLIYGDSLSAAYGLNPQQGWVHLLEQKLQANPATADITVINASISGETSGGGLSRLPAALALHKPDWLLLELGGNDGLRGYPLSQLRNNLTQMIDLAQAQTIPVILIGMQIPPNYGQRYTGQFESIYPELASAKGLPLIERWLQTIASQPDLMQADGIHPAANAQAAMMESVAAELLPLLTEKNTRL